MSLNHISSSNPTNVTDGLDVSFKNLDVSKDVEISGNTLMLGNLQVNGTVTWPTETSSGVYITTLATTFGGAVISAGDTIYFSNNGYYTIGFSAFIQAPAVGTGAFLVDVSPPPGRKFNQDNNALPTLTLTTSNNSDANGDNAICGRTEFASSSLLRLYLVKTGASGVAWNNEGLRVSVSGTFFTVPA